MTPEELDDSGCRFSAVLRLLADIFGRTEWRAQTIKCLHGLMVPVRRENGWTTTPSVGNHRLDARKGAL